MNGRTARALRKFATITGLPYSEAKHYWNRSPRNVRATYRKQVLEEIGKFSEQLKMWRGELTQKEAADKLGVPFETYRGWEYKKHFPSLLARAEVERRLKQ